MKATFSVGILLVGVLTAFAAVDVAAVQSQARTTNTKTVESPEKPAASAQKAPAKKRAPVASKSKSAREIAKKRLPSAKLDLSLPPEMVKQLQPIGTMPMPKHKPLLPNLDRKSVV